MGEVISEYIFMLCAAMKLKPAGLEYHEIDALQPRCLTVAVAQDAAAAGSSKFAFLEDGYCILAKLYLANFAKLKCFEQIWKLCHQARRCHQQSYSSTFTPGALAAASFHRPGCR